MFSQIFDFRNDAVAINPRPILMIRDKALQTDDPQIDGFDVLYDWFFVKGLKGLGRLFYRAGDQSLIDGAMVNGTGRFVRWVALKGRAFQSGYVYHYMAVMAFGLLAFLSWLLLG